MNFYFFVDGMKNLRHINYMKNELALAVVPSLLADHQKGTSNKQRPFRKP